MEDRTDAPQDLPVQIRQVRQALTHEFADLLDLTDVTSRSQQEQEMVFLTRALAAKAVQLVAGCTTAEAANAVTDGVDDNGIDAVMISSDTAEIWLTQARWSNNGRARFDSAAILRLLHGLKRIVNLRYDHFNAKFDPLIDQFNAALKVPNCRIHLVLAGIGDTGLAAESRDLLDEAASEFNQDQDLLDFRFLGTADFHSAARRGVASESVSVTATLSDGWHMNSTPYQTYLGTVGADELASWYEEHGRRLFDQNVRYPLGMTNVNVAVIESLLNNPHEFWYFNNGVTVLCDSVRARYFARRAVGQPTRLELVNARVVNGAQSVASVHHAFGRDPEAVMEARVSLRVICLDGAPADLAQRITQATNTQNHVEPRDFAALDPQQALIRQDFALSLGKIYVLKRGELEPAPAAGCTVVEAAFALACAYPDASVVARLWQDSSVLWSQGPRGIYAQLFGSPPTALQIWRSVGLMRGVRDALATLAARIEGREQMVADRADLLITHIAFQLIGSDGIDEPGDEWDARQQATLKRTEALLFALIEQLGAEYGQYALLARILRDEEGCRRLVSSVLESLKNSADRRLPRSGQPTRRRRPNTVPLLVQYGRIEDGTQLIYRPNSIPEREALHEWLSEAPERYLASWVNDDRKPLVWAVDEQRYSPTGLVFRIWEEAHWAEHPVAVAGPRSWYVPGEGTLADLASELLADEEVASDGPGAK
ncbi:AIPR family protein [Streptomyces sp. NRRL B-24720]|uniref:AIPR family protein n=1 Tax=Streptomyces sp. NRRL B-24720 TaxID=1476876 RepID=UPI0004C77E58|nr:AIPR family protein [Streptomyces sp. NRRL B-24720]